MKVINHKDLLNKIREIAVDNNKAIFIVGGFLRDLLLGIKKEAKIVDIDFAVDSDIEFFTNIVSEKLNCRQILLDKKIKTIRIVVADDLVYQLDFTEFKGKNIYEDLKHRDFTVNAFAMELGDFLESDSLKDIRERMIYPISALRDLRNRVIVPVSKFSIKEDTLRVLRCYSLGAYLQFDIPRATTHEIEKYSKFLSSVSQERIRDETFRLFSAKNSFRYLIEMDESGVFEDVFPELKRSKNVSQGPYHKLDVYYHTIECVKQFEIKLLRILDDAYLKSRLEKYLKECLAGFRNRKCLIKLALIYHDAGKPEARKIEKDKIKFWGHEKISKQIVRDAAIRLKLSNSEIRSLENMVFYHLRPGNLADQNVPDSKAAYRFFRHAGKDTPGTILLSVADKYATAGELVSEKSMKHHELFLIQLLKEYFRIQEEVEPEKIIDGNDIMEILSIKPSVQVGKILEEIKMLQMEGKINSRSEAVKFVEGLKEDN